MKHSTLLSILGFLFSIYSYSQEEKCNTYQLIEINPDIIFYWDNSTSEIVKDELWSTLKANYYKFKRTLINEVSNQKLTEAEVCYVEGKLTKGQMAFIALDQLEDIPYFTVFKMQYCVIHLGCPYADGLIESIVHNKKASKQLMKYFYKNN